MTVNAELEKQPKLACEPKKLKKQKLRNNEYYEMQSVFDELYAKSKEGKAFNKLIELIACENNILLAYRNIKNNKGSTTKGTDGLDITHYKDWDSDKFVTYFQNKLQNYHPKSVRRVEIPKPDGRKRPLGIPCMDDRIIQQCILQVLEPICEAKFHNHSYGFRPNRATSHAIARTQSLMNINKLYYVVDIDIKGFFDNVNHSKLMKQLWAMGIRDKNLLCVIGKILKSEIHGEGVPTKGTQQGGIISPLLSNIVLNELDWWLSNQWETKSTDYPYKYVTDRHSALRKSELKEFYFVRYADDFKIVCRNYQKAQKIFVATKLWLNERLDLEISPEKSKITNVRKGKTEFLGFALFVQKKGKEKGKDKFISRSNISNKATKAITAKLKGQIKAIQKKNKAEQVNLLNSQILGVHNYYGIATQCSNDFAKINFVVSRSLYNRLKGSTKKVKGKKNRNKKSKKTPEIEQAHYSKTYRKLYGNYKQKPKIILGIAVFPIYGCKFKVPLNFTQEICSYTEQGRALIHNRLSNVSGLIRYLLQNKDYNYPTEYNDNRISLIAGQNGKCAITNQPLIIGRMECHHKKPRSLGGTDEYKNLVWLDSRVHKLIHATNQNTISKYLKMLNLDNAMLKKVNSLRLLAENLEIIAIT